MDMHLSHPTATAYTERLEAFRQFDKERDDMVTDLVQKLKSLQERFDEKCADHEHEVASRRWLQSQCSEMKQASASNPFVVAIIDGDGAKFQDYLYAKGTDGGAKAAHTLRGEILDSLKRTYPNEYVSDWNITAYIILDLDGLTRKLQACGIISNFNDLRAFGCAFSMAEPLFSFIDVGSGKERADHKVRETLRLFAPMPQCKHIFVGPCSDTGYIVVLEKYKHDPKMAPRFTLIEAEPAEPRFHTLGMKMTRFPQTFRSDPLPARPTINGAPGTSPATLPTRALSSDVFAGTSSFQPQTTTALVCTDSSARAPSTDSAISTSWAEVGKSSASASKTINIASKKPAARRFILLNAYGNRLDPELPRADVAAEHRFHGRLMSMGKLCNEYHLHGSCSAGDYCDFLHGNPLSPSEQLVLKHKTRGWFCPGRSECRNFACLKGHQCPSRGRECPKGEECWFFDVHNMDTEPARRLFEDGSEEWSKAYVEKAVARR